jgi:hypothetical protein
MLKSISLCLAGCCAGLALAVAAAATGGPERTIPCREVLGVTTFPYLGSAQVRHRYRLVLDAVSVPPAYLEQVEPTGGEPWTHWAKRGMVVRAGAPGVTISVPPSWRTRVGITWGNGGHGVMSSIRIAGCGSDSSKGNAYAGGFYLSRAAACVPLVFRTERRSKTVWFGVGRRCP